MDCPKVSVKMRGLRFNEVKLKFYLGSYKEFEKDRKVHSFLFLHFLIKHGLKGILHHPFEFLIHFLLRLNWARKRGGGQFRAQQKASCHLPGQFKDEQKVPLSPEALQASQWIVLEAAVMCTKQQDGSARLLVKGGKKRWGDKVSEEEQNCD